MNFTEACQILNIKEDATSDDAKKSFKKLALQHHPDRNGGKDEEFKKINEAHQIFEAGPTPVNQGFGGGFDNFDLSDILSGFGGFARPSSKNKKRIPATDIHLKETISFKESVLGIQKNLKYKRTQVCGGCNGEGSKTINNGCDKCKGKGQIISQNGMGITVQPCPKCHGIMSSQNCLECATKGFTNVDADININIPAGVHNNDALSLRNMGNYLGNIMGGPTHTKVILQMIVTPQDGLSIIENDVHCSVDISLLEALEGCKKYVSSIDDFKEISIPAKSKHNDTVIISNLGVNRQGNQINNIKIHYPTDLTKLIATLKE